MQFSEEVTVLILYQQLAFTWFIHKKNVILEKNPERESQREKKGKVIFLLCFIISLTMNLKGYLPN